MVPLIVKLKNGSEPKQQVCTISRATYCAARVYPAMNLSLFISAWVFARIGAER